MTVKKADLGKGYQNPNENWEVITYFSENIELKFGKNIAIYSLYFNAILELWLLNYL